MLFGTGLQTWEYSPEFRLRTFAYLTPLAKLGDILKLFGVRDKILLFTILRSILAGFTGYCEFYFAQGVSKVWGETIGWSTLLLSLCSPGMFHSSGALLPSATAMQLVLLSTGNLCQDPQADGVSRSIFIGLIATLAIGWPFCAVCWIPIGLYAVLQAFCSGDDPSNRFKNATFVLLRTALHATIIQLIVCIIDYQWYQALTVPSLNIFMYNAAAGGDELYGIEPASYYLKNLALNFNFTLGLALAAPFAVLVNKRKQDDDNNGASSTPSFWLRLAVISPLLLWFLLIGPRPHKEERFVFPVYPLIVLVGAIGLENMIRLTDALWDKPVSSSSRGGKRQIQKWLRATALIVCAMFSSLRMLALFHFYSAPVQLYTALNEEILSSSSSTRSTNVCVGGDWHRFPSSFFLPKGSNLAFLPSDFKGQLPQPFTPGGVAVEPLQPFNDENREEISRYIAGGISNCDYTVELMLTEDKLLGRKSPATSLLMEAAGEKGRWNMISSVAFLDAERTHGLHRMLYIPRVSDSRAVLVDYALWKREK